MSLAIIFTGLFLDDAFELHEFLGRELARILSIPEFAHLIDQDRGEPIAWVLIGSFYLAILLLALPKSSATARKVAFTFVRLFILLAFFGIVTDFIHALIKGIEGVDTRVVSFAMKLVEDGGEMVVGSLMLATVYALYHSNQPSRPH